MANREIAVSGFEAYFSRREGEKWGSPAKSPLKPKAGLNGAPDLNGAPTGF
jgi:hypothetical protein